MGELAANLAAVLVVGALLGIETFVVAIVALAYLVSREAVTWRTVVTVGLALGLSAGGYVTLVVLIRGLLG